jgi:hypothetical protein
MQVTKPPGRVREGMRQSRHRSFFAVVLALGLLQVAQVGPVAGAPSGTDVDEGFLYEHPGTAGCVGSLRPAG